MYHVSSDQDDWMSDVDSKCNMHHRMQTCRLALRTFHSGSEIFLPRCHAERCQPIDTHKMAILCILVPVT
jgi:hypothetical protein